MPNDGASLMCSLPGVAFKSLACFPQQFRRHREITLSSCDIHVPQIGGQLWQQALHVSSLAVPGNQAMNREGMTHVMEPWLEPSSIMPFHFGTATQPAED